MIAIKPLYRDRIGSLAINRFSETGASCVIVYCPSPNICSDIYATFHYELGQDSYYPPGSEQNSVLGNALTI